VHEWQDDRVSGLAAEVAFFGVLSLFPALLAMAAALGVLEALAGAEAAAEAEDAVVSFLQGVLTHEAAGTIEAVQELFDGSSIGVLTVGLATALWAASRGFAAVIRALDVAYDIDERRTWVRLRALGIGLAIGTVVVASLLLAMLVLGPLLGTGQEVADAVGLGTVFATFWTWVRWPTIAALVIGWAATIFHVAPNHRTPWRWDVPGALLTAALWIVLSLGLRLYLVVASTGNQVLGTLGGSLIVLLWLYLLAVGLLLGGELNAILARRAGVPQEPRSP
jgi:membrane protein